MNCASSDCVATACICGLWMLADRCNHAKYEAVYLALYSHYLCSLIAHNSCKLEEIWLQQLMANDNLTVACEENAFEALVHWMHFDEGTCKAHYAEVIQSIVCI